ncbi:MAG: hypothetical protein ONB23_05290 [candidate division KSB1 bacterium]|nr:hypothetical protein [candidate division KSB1 bacterium]
MRQKRSGADPIRRAPFLVGLVAGLLAGPGAGLPRPRLELSGYAVHFAIHQQNPNALRRFFGLGRSRWINLTRLRLRPSVYLGSSARITLEHELDALRLSSAFPLIDPGGDARRQVFRWRWEALSRPRVRILHYVDRLYFRYDPPWGSLVIGRQRISWGSGRVWNPTDFFNPIHPAHFEKLEKDGADAASLKLHLGAFSDLQIVGNTEDRWHRKNVAARLRTNWRGYDLSLVGGYVDERPLIGGDFAGNLGDAGVRGEWAYLGPRPQAQRPFLKGILGVDHQLHPKLYALAEYHFNGEGEKERSRYDFARLFRGELLNVARHYLFVSAVFQPHPLVSWSLGGNLNLSDGSRFLLSSLTYSAGDNLAFSLGVQLFRGGEGTEYSLFPEAAFAKLEWYF